MLIKRDNFLPLQFKMAKLYFSSIVRGSSECIKGHKFYNREALDFFLASTKIQTHWSVKVYQKELQTYLTIIGKYKFVIQNQGSCKNLIFYDKGRQTIEWVATEIDRLS